MDVATFLGQVVTPEKAEGWFCLSLQTSEDFMNVWFWWPTDVSAIAATAMEAAKTANVFFNPRLFKEQSATKVNALETMTLSVDLDYAEIIKLPIQPTILLRSSEGRHQAHWQITEKLWGDEFEHLSKKLTYAIDNADPSGWTINHKFRLPNTINYKYDPAQETSVIEHTGRVYAVADIELLPEPPPILATTFDDFINSEPTGDIGPNELLESIRGKIPARVYSMYNTTVHDRSAMLWATMCSAFRAGLNREDVYFLAYHSANNKFKSQRANGLRDLAKDVLRAERAAQTIDDDAKEIVDAIRKLGGNATERHKLLAEAIIELMKKSGTFVSTDDDEAWYIPFSSGVPIVLSRHSNRLSILIDSRYGLNPVEREHSYVMARITTFGASLPTTGTLARMAYYDRPTNSVLLHSGRRDVMHITANGVSVVPNGSQGVVFPWIPNAEPFAPMVPSANVPSCWADSLFKDTLSNVVNMTAEEAYALMRVWFLFMIFRNDASARPLLALFGQQGSGKTTLMSKIYTLVYGKKMEIGRITNPEDFDMTVSKYPMAVFDNVDTYEKWLPDRLATAAKNTKSNRRKLYTDDDIITISGTAMIGLTAHDPKFTRADVVDRLVVLMFKRIHDFMPEGEMINDVYQRRNILWGHVVADVQKILKTPRPAISSTQLRSADLVHLGRWFSSALKVSAAFESSITALVRAQKKQALASEALLLEALNKYTHNGKHDGQWRSIGAIWLELSCSGDTHAFNKRYHDAQSLDNKLWVLQEPLSSVIRVEWREKTGIREWLIEAVSDDG